jgi:NADPH:quinone reductase-like Zn-dependent oxidoreductase
MQAFVIDRYKGALTRREMPEPKLRSGDVLVAIQAASVNPIDVKIRDGDFKLILPYQLPLVLGNDFAGTVKAVGAQARRFKVGDQVYGRPGKDRIGTFAERIAVSENDLSPKPGSLDMKHAAALPLVALTAWQALVDRAGVKPGQKVFIHAGSGGVGSIAIQLAKHLGATVATTVGTDSVALAESLGADVVIDYRKDRFEEHLSDYDIVLNSLGSDVLEKSLLVLKLGGKLISISGPPDPAFAREMGANWFLRQVFRALSFGIRRKAKARGVSYSFLFMRPDGEQLSKIATLVDSGVVRPLIDRVFSFEETPGAVARVESGRAKGKVVIDFSTTKPRRQSAS